MPVLSTERGLSTAHVNRPLFLIPTLTLRLTPIRTRGSGRNPHPQKKNGYDLAFYRPHAILAILFIPPSPSLVPPSVSSPTLCAGSRLPLGLQQR